ncbi:MAG: hypothetical protein CMN55_16880 [Sneathiella sp.]|jgi:hypothetical protein|uniref:hypothetical protein n=1 Tax=Sneathiella sp. TaxID=1964365 RepID=UPI000C4BCD9E|nr:hypothetical protein [Sneathiella sp.]MAL80751.1 hypothetical protein [Sneathiella sp.]|tara:strand:- start:8 stop:385 length:378 start_codon:yes stop_codon:yes gene_type:complete
MPDYVRIQKGPELTIIEFLGPLTEKTFFAAFREGVTKNLLFIFSDVHNFYDLTPRTLEELAKFSATFDHLRPNGRSASVVTGPMQQSIVNLYAAISHAVVERKIEFRSFTNEEDALNWLNSKDGK